MWTIYSESFVRRDWLSQPSYKHIKASAMKEALREVATKRHGHRVLQSEKTDVLTFCHKMGFLHIESSDSADHITYLFASPVHRRYMILIPSCHSLANSRKQGRFSTSLPWSRSQLGRPRAHTPRDLHQRYSEIQSVCNTTSTKDVSKSLGYSRSGISK